MQRRAAETYPMLKRYIARKLQLIAELEQSVERYEKKRMMEERAYHSMTPIRRLFTGKKPDHHLAVEYIHYVKKPLEQIRKLRVEAEAARTLLEQSHPDDLLELPEEMEKELI